MTQVPETSQFIWKTTKKNFKKVSVAAGVARFGSVPESYS